MYKTSHARALDEFVLLIHDARLRGGFDILLLNLERISKVPNGRRSHSGKERGKFKMHTCMPILMWVISTCSTCTPVCFSSVKVVALVR